MVFLVTEVYLVRCRGNPAKARPNSHSCLEWVGKHSDCIDKRSALPEHNDDNCALGIVVLY